MKKSDSKRQAILETAYHLFRAQGFDKTSIGEITARVGGSKATIYSHFASKEELFAECMMAAAENYMSGTVKHLDASRADPELALRDFGASVLNVICSAEQLEVRRLMIAEAARSGTGKLFFNKLTALRAHVSTFLSACMSSGMLRRDDPDLAADHLGALLEAELLEPLLLHVREDSPNRRETALAAKRAMAAFLRAYAPVREPANEVDIYAEFISEASRHLVNAWGHEMNSRESLAGIYSALERIRLTSSAAVVGAAERVMQQVVAAYNAPNKTYDELQRLVMQGGIASPLTEFSDACRREVPIAGV